MRRLGLKQRATLYAGFAALALVPMPGAATVIEFDEAGAASTRPTINYIQRARFDRIREDDEGPEVTVSDVPNSSAETGRNALNYTEHTVNNNSHPNSPSVGSTRSATAGHYDNSSFDALGLISSLPPHAMTYVDVTTTRLPTQKNLARSSVWLVDARRVAEAHDLPPDLFLALIDAESGFNARAVSPKGAIGLTQLMPGTAAALGVDPHDPEENLIGGARYLAQQFERFGTWKLALAAYNAGPTRVARLGRIPNIPETKAFVARVTKASGLNFHSITTASN